jgi:hypothetical protein
MNFVRSAAAVALALALCHGAAQASSASSYASIYDITFSFEGDGGGTFAGPAGEGTYVQAFNGMDLSFDSAAALFSTLSTNALLSGPTGTTSATASGTVNSLTAEGTTNVAGGQYAADATYNQADADGNSTQGGILHLAANTRVTLTGYYDLRSELTVPYCEVSGATCSSAGAEVRFGLGSDFQSDSVSVSGEYGGLTSRSVIGQFFSLSFWNSSDSVMDVFFSLASSVFGMAANVADDGSGGTDGGPGGGNVPVPSTLALLALALLALQATSRGRGVRVPRPARVPAGA